MADTAQKTPPEPADDNTLFLVDGSGYIFRAYFAVPQTLTNPEGVSVGAVLGFTNMLLKLLTDLHAPSIAVIFDAARENFRNEIYPDYKAHRPPAPEDLVPQFPLIREATEAFGIPAIDLEGYEADDLIATYARQAVAQGRKVVIVGTDKDLMQLVDEDVCLFDPIKSKYIYAAEVEEKFGVPPEKVIDVQALAGDSTDNVPGVPGIGVKTAAQLIQEYGDLDTLLERAGEIKQNKRRESLIEHAEMARVSKQLVTLDVNAPVPLALEDMAARDPHTPELAAFLQAQGFNSVLNRLNKNGVTPAKAGAGSLSAETLQPDPRVRGDDDERGIENNKYTLITDMDTLKQWIERACETGFLAIDTETTGLTPAKVDLVGISIACEIGKAAYIPLGHTQERDLLGEPQDDIEQLPAREVMDLLKPLLEDASVLKIGQNLKYDWQMFAAHDIHMAPCEDTMLLSYVLDGTEHGHGMDELSKLHLEHEPIKYDSLTGTGKNRITFDRVPVENALDYAAEDAEITLRLHKILKPRLAREKMCVVYEDIERPLIPMIAEMERTGIKVDVSVLKSLSNDFGKRIVEMESEIHTLAGHTFNVGSPKQVGAILFGEMGLEGGKKTKTGEWSTAVDVLEKLAMQGHEIAQKILDWRQLSKLKSTYTDALQEEINPRTGRIHTSFHMTGTSTGRLASSDPNMQNIPIRTEEGRKIRHAFVADEGWQILSADYSQVELRLAAAMADVKALKQAFHEGVDIHALTASRVFDVPLEQVSPDLRYQAKAVNFGIIYGISGWGLAKQLGCDPADANGFIRAYLTEFKEIQDYMERTKEEARTHGFVRTLYGRKCVVFDARSKDHARRAAAERQAINAPLQGTAADIMKIAMARIPRAMEEAGLRGRLLLQVHDEVILEAPAEECEDTAVLVCQVMEGVADIGVPLVAEAGWGKSWGEGKG